MPDRQYNQPREHPSPGAGLWSLGSGQPRARKWIRWKVWQMALFIRCHSSLSLFNITSFLYSNPSLKQSARLFSLSPHTYVPLSFCPVVLLHLSYSCAILSLKDLSDMETISDSWKNRNLLYLSNRDMFAWHGMPLRPYHAGEQKVAFHGMRNV